jgi:uncharacterized membrane protein
VVSRVYWVILVRAQKTKRPVGIRTVRVMLMRFQIGMRTLSGTVLEAIHVVFWKRIYYVLFMPQDFV